MLYCELLIYNLLKYCVKAVVLNISTLARVILLKNRSVMNLCRDSLSSLNYPNCHWCYNSLICKHIWWSPQLLHYNWKMLSENITPLCFYFTTARFWQLCKLPTQYNCTANSKKDLNILKPNVVLFWSRGQNYKAMFLCTPSPVLSSTLNSIWQWVINISSPLPPSLLPYCTFISPSLA